MQLFEDKFKRKIAPFRLLSVVQKFRVLKLPIREFKKLRRLLQRKRDIKIELCVTVSVSRLVQVGHVV